MAAGLNVAWIKRHIDLNNESSAIMPSFLRFHVCLVVLSSEGLVPIESREK